MISNWINHKNSRGQFTLWCSRLLKSWVLGYKVYTLNREHDCVIHFSIAFYKVIEIVFLQHMSFWNSKSTLSWLHFTELDRITVNFISLSAISCRCHIWLQIWCSFNSFMLKHAYLLSSIPLFQCFLLLKIQLSDLCVITTFL